MQNYLFNLECEQEINFPFVINSNTLIQHWIIATKMGITDSGLKNKKAYTKSPGSASVGASCHSNRAEATPDSLLRAKNK